jgi:hypothetical protein
MWVRVPPRVSDEAGEHRRHGDLRQPALVAGVAKAGVEAGDRAVATGRLVGGSPKLSTP